MTGGAGTRAIKGSRALLFGFLDIGRAPMNLAATASHRFAWTSKNKQGRQQGGLDDPGWEGRGRHRCLSTLVDYPLHRAKAKPKPEGKRRSASRFHDFFGFPGNEEQHRPEVPFHGRRGVCRSSYPPSRNACWQVSAGRIIRHNLAGCRYINRPSIGAHLRSILSVTALQPRLPS